MIQYLRFLFFSLIGRNPFRIELDEINKELESVKEYRRILKLMYQVLLSKWNAEKELTKKLRRENEEQQQQIKDLQVLVENLRERIREKDEEIKQQGREFRERVERIKSDYQLRIEAYNKVLDKQERGLKFEIIK